MTDGAQEKLLLRMPPELKAWLKAEAAKNRRSINSEILMILEGYRSKRWKE